MTLSALGKFVLPPVIASIAVFSVMSLPLAAFGDKQIVIRMQEEPIVHGKLRDVAPLYVVMTTILSLGAGISAAAISGWQRSSRKSIEFRQQLSNLEEDLQQKEELLKELKLSESRLEVSGLGAFLNDEMPFEQAINQKALNPTVSQPVVAQTPASVYRQPINAAPRIASKQNTTISVGTTAAVPGFASAQTLIGYSHANSSDSKENAVAYEVNKTTIAPSEVEELQRQIQQMMLQMQAMQDNLRLIPQTTPVDAQAKGPDKFRIYYDAPVSDEVRF